MCQAGIVLYMCSDSIINLLLFVEEKFVSKFTRHVDYVPSWFKLVKNSYDRKTKTKYTNNRFHARRCVQSHE